MKLYSYAITEMGKNAPNPYFGYCTLAVGKPIIRKCAQEGDWIAVFGGERTAMQGKLIVLMQVDEILTYDEYWEDERFREKRPVSDKEGVHIFGDNMYHHAGFKWVKEVSCIAENESTEQVNLKIDTQTNRVLIASEFYYFEEALEMPQEFSKLIAQGAGHSVCADKQVIEMFVGATRRRFEMKTLS